ncbi:MAG: hypothetical protein V1847_00070 [Candidatus Diapherotrites archaeon]
MKRNGFYLSISAGLFLLLLALALNSFPHSSAPEWKRVLELQQSHDFLTVWLLGDSSFEQKIQDLQSFGGAWKLEQGAQKWQNGNSSNALSVEGLFVENRSLEEVRLTRFEDD